jgi:hypothetical protein
MSGEGNRSFPFSKDPVQIFLPLNNQAPFQVFYRKEDETNSLIESDQNIPERTAGNRFDFPLALFSPESQTEVSESDSPPPLPAEIKTISRTSTQET